MFLFTYYLLLIDFQLNHPYKACPHPPCDQYKILLFPPDLKAFLQNLYACWENKQREVEERFLYCENQVAVEEPKPKKRKRGQKKAPQQNPEDPFAELAAELQVEFFTKVSIGSVS